MYLNSAMVTANRKISLARLTFLIYLTWSVLYAPIKWIANLSGLGFLFYIPKILLILVVIISIFSKKKINKPTLYMVCILLVSSCVSFFYMRNIDQVFFALYIFIPFIFTLYFGEYLISESIHRYFIFLWSLTCFGLFLNAFITFPWAGASIEINGQAVYVAKEWSTYGVSRYAGFSVASWSVASQLLGLGTYLFCFTKQRYIKLFYFIVTILCMLLTTAKGPIFAFFIMGIVTLISNKKTYIVKGFFYPPIIIGIGLPLLSYAYFGSISYSGRTGTSWLFTAETIYARMTLTWPLAIDFVLSKGNVFTGVGLGGMGSPLGIFYDAIDSFKINDFSFADSLYVYTFAIFGIPGIYILLKIVNRAKDMKWRNKEYLFSSFIILELLYFGVVDAPYERDFFICFIGISIAILFKRKIEKSE